MHEGELAAQLARHAMRHAVPGPAVGISRLAGVYGWPDAPAPGGRMTGTNFG
jgi:hypothetical protein